MHGARSTRRAGATLLPALLVLATACGGASSAEQSSSSTSPTAPASSQTATAEVTPSATPGIDPAHAVPPPGKRKGSLTYADILVFSPRTLSADSIAAIRKLKGVASAESLAMAQVGIENKVVNVAAVDPGSYRNFTPAGTADAQEVWDRVAGGELALTPKLRKKAPVDEAGYLRLGSNKEAPEVHIGAYAEQVLQIDAVVNETWIPTLGMKPANALVINTGSTAPTSLRKAIEQIIGAQGSVQMLDAVARYGLDINATQTAFLVGSVADAVGVFTYTVLGGGRIAPAAAWVSAHIATAAVPILGTVTCNRMVFPQLRAALEEIVARGLADKIHPGEYAGCYYPRFIAGTTSLSNHSFGLALDLNVPGNGRGTVGQMDRTVVSIFKRWGFAWGGDWGYTDPMHFEMNALIDPR